MRLDVTCEVGKDRLCSGFIKYPGSFEETDFIRLLCVIF